MPKLEKVTVMHEASITANMGDYESYKSTVALSETHDVTDLDSKKVDAFVEGRRKALHEQVDAIVEVEYNKNSKFAKAG